jgi:hypothetical protein
MLCLMSKMIDRFLGYLRELFLFYLFTCMELHKLRRIFGPKRDEVRENGENCIMRSFITLFLAKHN